jgi:replicative DNA helicase
MAAIKMLQIRSTITRMEQKHGDLSIADIEQLQKSKGSCVAAAEIDKRTQNGAKLGFF